MNIVVELSVVTFWVCVLMVAFAKKIWKAMDKYMETKAKNYATKQDVAVITEKTEEVHAKFRKDMERFNKDLQFKYKLYEEQYNDLYVKLYQLICKSESLRYLYRLRGISDDFKSLPIVEETNKNGGSIIQEIVTLVNAKLSKATPELLKTVSLLDAVGGFSRSSSSSKKTETSNIEIQLRINLVNTILKDFCWLRTQLQLPFCDEEIDIDCWIDGIL